MKAWTNRLILLFSPLLFALPSVAQEAGSLTVEAFLSDVKGHNQEVRGALQSSEGALKRSREKDLLLSPSFFADAQVASDAKLPAVNIFTYDRVENRTLNLGLQQLTSYGQAMKLYYNMGHTNFVNVRLPGGGTPPATSFFETKPTFEISQSLWGNGFGRGVTANMTLLESQALATSYHAQFRARAALVAAEESYWRLALARERVEVMKSALDQARKIREWSAGRARSNLGDQADALQARAAFEVRQLEMQSAIDEERAASRAFNKARNQDSDVVQEELQVVDVEGLLEVKPGERVEKRDDVKAAEEQQKAAIAASQASIEKNTPSLDAYAAFSLNGRNSGFGPALTDPFTANRPTYAVGVKFVMPLNRGVASDAVDGLRQEQKAAEILLAHKLNEQELDWKDLSQKLSEVKKRLQLSQSITDAQKAKLSYERGRLKQGRTTTYQVLLFEQDFAQSQLALLQAEAAVISLTTQMKLYGGAL